LRGEVPAVTTIVVVIVCEGRVMPIVCVPGVNGCRSATHPWPTDSPPWALELMSGERCVFAEGATSVVEGRRLNYTCSRSHYLWGPPDTSHALWRIRASRNYEGTHMRRLAIRVALR
jgi:hypothetical protein